MRLEAASAIVRESVPTEYADLVIAITELGGPTTLTVLLAVLFWCGHRRRTALVISYAVAGLGFVLTLETVLAVPRPPADVWTASLEVDGYGFPSGHAFAAAVVYGGLVSASGRLRDPLAVAGAAVLIAAVSLSRVVLGVHYLGDVVAGAVLGVAFVAAMNRLTRCVPVVGFGIGFVFALPAVAVTGAAPDALLALGGSVGGLVAAGWIDRLPRPGSRLEGLALVAVGGSVVAIAQVVEELVRFEPILVALYAALVAWVVLAPVVVDRLSRDGLGSIA